MAHFHINVASSVLFCFVALAADCSISRAASSDSMARIALGEALFFDPLLSIDQTRSCATCHDPGKNFQDGVPKASPQKPIARNTSPIFNRAHTTLQGADGSSQSLEDQVLRPILDPFEMGMTAELLVNRLLNERRYDDLFAAAFGAPPSLSNIAAAIAAFERTIRCSNSSYDRYIAGDFSAMSPEQVAGMSLFFGKAGCADCHSGQEFSDEAFHVTGLSMPASDDVADHGRFLVSNNLADRSAFRTKTLRQIAATAPYFHNGTMSTLLEVIQAYNQPIEIRGITRDPRIRPLGLSPTEMHQLERFLHALSDGHITYGPPGQSEFAAALP